jgi:ATP-dependent Clp protease ATP-binding subunit ClpA
MFERFTTDARAVVIGAQEQSRRLNHRRIGTEHLLLALLAQPGAPAAILRDVGLTSERVTAEIEWLLRAGSLGDSDAEALEAIGIDLDAVRAKLEETFGPGALDPPPEPGPRGLFRRRSDAHLPFSARAKKVLELSLREAIHLRAREIRAEHILLGLLRDSGGLAARVIADAGVSSDLRERTVDALRRAA